MPAPDPARKAARKAAPRAARTAVRTAAAGAAGSVVPGEPPYELRRSTRAKRVTLRVVHGRGLVVTVPARASRATAAAAVEAHRDWALAELAALEARVPAELRAWPPHAVRLPAIGRRVVLGFEPEAGGRVATRPSSADAETVLVLPCAPDDLETGAAHLAAWLAREARAALGARLDALARRHGLRYRRLAVRGQRTLWGSCSAAGTISLNWKLLFLSPELVDYVLLHELAHTRHLDHSTAFWTLLERLVPGARALDAALARAGCRVPSWLEGRGTAARARAVPRAPSGTSSRGR